MKLISKLLTLFWIFLSISSVALGGGLAMLPLMSKEFVEKRGWLSSEDMVDTVAVMQSLPGIISINMAVLLGYKIAGVAGAVASVFGVVFSPFIVILLIAMFLERLDDSATMNHIFLGVRSGVAALIFLSVVKLARKVVIGYFSLSLALFGFVALVVFDMNAVLLVVLGAIAGLGKAYVPLLLKSWKR